MGSCMVALDPATRHNGCLQVLKGSHRLGRLDHGPVVDPFGTGSVFVSVSVSVPGSGSGSGSGSSSDFGSVVVGDATVALGMSLEQHGADPERVKLAQAAGCERLHCELDPGDAVFFHCNTLVRSHIYACRHNAIMVDALLRRLREARVLWACAARVRVGLCHLHACACVTCAMLDLPVQTSIGRTRSDPVATLDGLSYAATTLSITVWTTTQATLAVRLPPQAVLLRHAKYCRTISNTVHTETV